MNTTKKATSCPNATYAFLLVGLFLMACQQDKKGENLTFSLQALPTPSKEGAQPNFHLSAQGQLYLSWVEYLNDSTDALLFSHLETGQWVAAKEIAKGSDWFVNWADFPTFVSSRDGKTLAAHWLQKRAAGTYDYDVRISQSLDNGNTWSEAFIPHRDSIAAEHGFVSMLALPNNQLFATWLDGRFTKTKENNPPHPAGEAQGGAMTIRAATFDAKGQLSEETELDFRVCDCCQTAAALTSKGPIVAYRNRSDEEIRDIGIVRQVDGQWTDPTIVFPDHWKIAGCPVNGPALAAQADEVAIAWFTGANEQASVKVAFSNDAGALFGTPFIIPDASPLGRVDIVWVGPGKAIVSWLSQAEEKEEASIKLQYYTPAGAQGPAQTVIKTDPSRNSGFPILAYAEESLYLAWTAVDSLSTTVVKTAKVILP